MKIIIAGSRTLWNYEAVDMAIQKTGWRVDEVFCGMAAGADCVGWAWAHVNNIPIREFYADWEQWGKRAGPIRNTQMAQQADALVLLWDGISNGSRHMLELANRLGLQTCVIEALSLS